ncbi:MAG: NAD(P)-dependent oxidoreductase [Lentisphaeraceae bacterium]|nr:NAD(P)-dependent oxidoreductase [Lentisphaeraceae bacterium]
MSNKKIAFIGLGVMGQSMARNLMKAGHELHLFTRTKSKATALIEEGATWHDTVATCVADVDVVITIVGYPKDVREVYLGTNGILSSAKEKTLLVDMTTSEPSLAKEIYEHAKEKNLFSLDAPVSGGDVGALNGTLSIMVGGDENIFNDTKPLFDLLGKTIVYQGLAGSGQHTKMANQIAIASNMIGVMEALLYAQKSGLDPMTVLDSIGSGAAGSWSLNNLYPRVVKDDFDPGFFIIHFIKDMKIAAEEALKMGLTLPGLKMALGFYEKLEQTGRGLLGTQTLYQILEEMNLEG